MFTARLPALALVAALAGVTAVQAQDAPPPAPAGAQAGHWDPAQMRARMEAHRAERLKALHDVLGIRPDQEAAFQAFAASMRPPEGGPGMGGMRHGDMGQDRAAIANMTTPERLDHMAQRMQERISRHQQRFAQRAAATKALYAALGPDQRRTMDALPLLRGGRGGHGGGWGRGHSHWGGHGMDDHGQG